MKEALELINLITNHGYEAYLIGGFPRDYYLGVTATDIDICTNALEEQLTFLDIKKSSFGCMQVEYKNRLYEITTYRKDVKYHHRLPEINYVKTLKEDILRRDFTINTLAIDKNNQYVDYLNAKEDIDNKVIKTVGDPYLRLEEDILRLLRAIRFSVLLNFKIDPNLEKAILEKRMLLKNLSNTRISEELKKCFIKNSIKTISLLKYYQLENILNLGFNNFIETSSWITILAQIDKNNLYTFKKIERKMIEQIRHLSTQKEYSNKDLYTYSKEIWVNLETIKHQNLIERYDQLKIHSRKEIKVDKTLPHLDKIYPLLEEAILNNQLLNEKTSIQNYLVQKG